MPSVREVRLVEEPVPVREGAGVRLRRAFGPSQYELFDPYLMLDDFRCAEPSQYEAGFPWHPHRGIETITYIIEGEVEHGDSIGNSGAIGAGDVQWMSAGSGIIHQEMPHGTAAGRMGGFQLWANLPARRKMSDPSYRSIKASEIPTVSAEGATVRVIAGTEGEQRGPAYDEDLDPGYLDVTLQPGASWAHSTPAQHTAFAYLFEGSVSFGGEAEEIEAKQGTLVLFGHGDAFSATAGARGARFLLLTGKPLHEAVAWRGPVVMNTREELEEAFRDLDRGTFVKHEASL